MSPRGGQRKGAGRPRELEGAKRVLVTLDAQSLEKLDGVSLRLGISRSAAVRWVVARAWVPEEVG